MGKRRSTKDLVLSNNERHYLKKNQKMLFNFPIVKNLSSKFVAFYTFNGGFKKKLDDVLIAIFKHPIPVEAVYSKTATPAAPIIWDRKNNKGLCKILIINSGNANAHTGKDGLKSIEKYVSEAANFFKCSKKQILVSSTGVIGEQLDANKISKLYPYTLTSKKRNLLSAAKSIMTTDTFPKTILKKIKLGSKEIRIFGFAKGSGMIFPNMGTMLGYIFIEANIDNKNLKKILRLNLDSTFNSITVDGDTSTNDTVMVFSLFNPSEKKIVKQLFLKKISKCLKEVMSKLALQIVCDGEGISKLMEINISGAKSYKQASSIAFSIGNSPLVKTAIAGSDANWGRVIMAIGKSNENIRQEKIKLKFGNFLLANKGKMYNKINIKKLDKYMAQKLININVDLGLGKHSRKIYASDLTHEYVKINGDYRS